MALMDLESLKRQLDMMPPEDRKAFLEDLVASYEDEGTVLDERSDYADELRGTAQPGMLNAGRFRVAANPMQHIGAAGRRMLGDLETRRTMEDRRKLGERKSGALGDLMQMLMARQSQPAGMYSATPQQQQADYLRYGAMGP